MQETLGKLCGIGKQFIKPGECISSEEYKTRFKKWAQDMEAEQGREIPQANKEFFLNAISNPNGCCFPYPLDASMPLWASYGVERYLNEHPNFPNSTER